MNKEETIGTLNSLLQGSYIAIDSYSRFIGKVKDEQLRHRLENQQLTHKLIAQELNSHIRDIGGEPKAGSGLKGTVSEMSNAIKLATGDRPNEILDLLKEGVEMGIKSMQDALIKLEGKSQTMVSRHLEREKAILEKIKEVKQNLH